MRRDWAHTGCHGHTSLLFLLLINLDICFCILFWFCFFPLSGTKSDKLTNGPLRSEPCGYVQLLKQRRKCLLLGREPQDRESQEVWRKWVWQKHMTWQQKGSYWDRVQRATGEWEKIKAKFCLTVPRVNLILCIVILKLDFNLKLR